LHHAAAPGRTKLTEDATLLLHLNNIRQLEQQQHQQQQEYEHQLMTCSNKHLVHLTNELAQAHLDLCRAYSPKFPELQELIGDPVQYKNAVRVISNEMDVTKLTDQLNLILGSNQIITISVAASTSSGQPLTSSGQPLTESELEQVAHCADYMDDIILMQEELTAFVESRITALAPSMCALVGPSTAAKLVGLAGGRPRPTFQHPCLQFASHGSSQAQCCFQIWSFQYLHATAYWHSGRIATGPECPVVFAKEGAQGGSSEARPESEYIKYSTTMHDCMSFYSAAV
jgi:hypothetical protein